MNFSWHFYSSKNVRFLQWLVFPSCVWRKRCIVIFCAKKGVVSRNAILTQTNASSAVLGNQTSFKTSKGVLTESFGSEGKTNLDFTIVAHLPIVI